MAKRAKVKVNLPICAAAILLCLTLFSMHLTSGVYARYTATASGSDSARVIQFGNITLTKLGADTQYIAPGVELTWGAAVSFSGSESATYVFVEVDPEGTSWSVSSDGKTLTPFTDGPSWTVANDWVFLKAEDDGTCIYYLSLAPNQTLSAKALFAADVVTVPDTLTASQIDTLSTLSADFRASVVQSNGFDSVADAWDSVKAH